MSQRLRGIRLPAVNYPRLVRRLRDLGLAKFWARFGQNPDCRDSRGSGWFREGIAWASGGFSNQHLGLRWRLPHDDALLGARAPVS